MPKKYKNEQKIYKMKGCSKTSKTLKNKYLGGSIKNAYPNIGPNPGGFNFLNPQTGGCGEQCGIHMKGGTREMRGMKGIHRIGCKCSTCKNSMKGGMPYPNGLLGNAWTPSVTGWPGVDNISMNRNHLEYNTYTNDVSRQMRDVGAAPPFTYLGGGLSPELAEKNLSNFRRPAFGENSSFSPIEIQKKVDIKLAPSIHFLKHAKSKKSKKLNKSNKSKKTQRMYGGNTNFLNQDLVNVGRQIQYGLGSTYNAIRGYTAPVNPLPWKDQLK
jgi:hypothetical protein